MNAGWYPQRRGRGTSLTAPSTLSAPVVHSPRWAWNSYSNYNGQTPQAVKDTYRIEHTADVNCSNPRMVIQNSLTNQVGEVGSLPALANVRAAIEYPVGTLWPVMFGGSRTLASVASNVFQESDPIVGLTLVAGQKFYSRIYVESVGLAVPVQEYAAHWYGPNCGHSGDAADHVDEVAFPSFAAVDGMIRIFCHAALTGTTASPQPRVAVLGDSIAAAGLGSVGDGGAGFIVNALTDAGIPYFHAAYPGEAAVQFYNNNAGTGVSSHGSPCRLGIAKGCTSVVYQYGANDARGRVSVAYWQEAVQHAAAAIQAAGKRFYLTTVTPYSASSDVWATLVNQTDPDPGFNPWLRLAQMRTYAAGPPANVDGCFDSGGAVLDGDKWIVNGSPGYACSDGIHPTAAGHDLMSAAIDTVALAMP